MLRADEPERPVDVFIGPHTRMKDLVVTMKSIVESTNFANRESLGRLISHLDMTFGAFKSHEEIENQYIVEQLHSRLAIGHCLMLENDMHGDNRLGELIVLFRHVQSVVSRESCKKSLRVQQGRRLRKELESFMVDFIPHMEEEEAVLQPLLSKHFSLAELELLRETLIQLHHPAHNMSVVVIPLTAASLRWSYYLGSAMLASRPSGTAVSSSRCLMAPVQSSADCTSNSRVAEKRPSQPAAMADSCVITTRFACILVSSQKAVQTEEELRIKELPHTEEVRHAEEVPPCEGSSIQALPPEVLLRIFRHIDDVRWLLSCSMVSRLWRRLVLDPPLWHTLCPIKWLNGDWCLSFDGGGSFAMDEDDESSDEADSPDGLYDTLESDGQQKLVAHEYTFLERICNNLLPLIGKGVRNLSLLGSSALDNQLLHRLLSLCPKVDHLNIARTSVSTLGLSSSLHSHFRYANLSGCVNVTDVTVQSLAQVLVGDRSSYAQTCCSEDESRLSALEHLDLSGCHRITDTGIRHLLVEGGHPGLVHLDLSGLSKISGNTIRSLVDICPKLTAEHLFFCDNIDSAGDCVLSTARGCRGVCCKGLACCRAGF